MRGPMSQKQRAMYSRIKTEGRRPDNAALAEMVVAGRNVKELAAEYGITDAAVYAAMRQAGYTMTRIWAKTEPDD